MKKTLYRILTLLLILTLALSLTACGKNAAVTKAAGAPAYGPAYAEEAFAYPMEAMEEPAAAADYAVNGVGGVGARGSDGGLGSSGGSAMQETRPSKIIYTAYARLESTDYDSAVDAVYELVEKMGGYMESTSISGSDYSSIARGYASLRSASFTIRIPCEKFEEFTGTLSAIGNIPYCNTSSENITMQYYDVQSRLTAYETQEARLLEMLAIAESVDDMLAIQQQLTEVQYQLDSIKSTLRYYDNQVGYSTVNLDVSEVKEYTPEPTVRLSYWERMSRGFRDSLKSIGTFFTNLFLWIVTNLPILILLALVICALLWLVLHLLEKRKAGRTAEKKGTRRERKAARLAKRSAAPEQTGESTGDSDEDAE